MRNAALKALCSRIPGATPWFSHQPWGAHSRSVGRVERPPNRHVITAGKADAVLAASGALILEPLAGHAPPRTHITNPDLRGPIKHLAAWTCLRDFSETVIVVAA